MARGTPRPSPSITTVAQAVAGGAVGYIQSQINNPFMPGGAGVQNVYAALPLLGTSDIATLIDMAREQSRAGLAFGEGDIYRKPRLSEIPICPGCPSGKIELTISVDLFDPTRFDQYGNLEKITHGFAHAVFDHIPTSDEIRAEAESWAESIMESSYAQAGGFQTQYEVSSAQRGTFFGR